MRMFSEEVKHTFSNSPLNILQVADFNEVFFGVYEVEINKRKYPVEEVSKYNGTPVVSIPIVVEGVEKEYPFVLLRGEEEIIFNESNTEIPESDMEIVEEAVVDNEQILIDIQNLKKEAVRQAQEELSKNTKILIEKNKREKAKKEKALKNYLESARENLVDEFTNISKRIKNELISENDERFSEIKETIDNKIQDLADALNESLKKDFNNSSKLIDKSVKQLVKDLYEKNINPRVDKELEEIAIGIVEKVSEIDKNLDKKIAKKADVSLVEGVSREVEAIRDSNIELNNSLNKGVQKALSRVGNVDKKVLQILEEVEQKLEKKEKEFADYFHEKLALANIETLNINEEAKKKFENLIQENRNNLLSEIHKKAKESIDDKIGNLSNILNESLKKDFKKSSLSLDKSIKKLVKDLYENTIDPKIDKELHDIAVDIHEKVSEIEKNLDSKLDDKVDNSLLEGINSEISVIRDANIELNNSLNDGLKNTISKVGNLDKKIVKVSEKFKRKLEETEREVTSYFEEKINLLKEETLDITDEARSYFQNLIQESRNGLLSEIRKIKNEKPVEYLLESKKGEPIVKDWDSIEKDWNKKIHDKIENVRTDLRKYVAVYASGGGTNAQQFADGGTINGDLNVTGSILSGGMNLSDIFGGGSNVSSLSANWENTYTTVQANSATWGIVGLTNPVEVLEFDTNYSVSGSENIGSLFWNDVNGTISLKTSADSTLDIGQETRYYGKASGDITNGQLVQFAGSQGDHVLFKVCVPAEVIANPKLFMGVATEDIANGSFGNVTRFGYVTMNTTGWSQNDLLYFDNTTGQMTNVAPNAPEINITIAAVIKEESSPAAANGIILVRPSWGLKMQDLDDFDGTPLSADGQIPVWNNAGGYFDPNYNINNYALLTDILTWEYLVSKWSVEPVTIASITGGDVWGYTLNSITRYRFVPTVYDPTQDGFYANFDGTNLTNLITTRG